MAQLIKWSDLETGFCESIWTQPPEYGAAFSSLFMTIFGLMGIFISRNTNILLRIVSAALAVTGIGSFMYHWTLYAGWGYMDSIPMLISSWLGAYMAYDSILYKKYVLDINDRRTYEILSGVLSVIFMSAMVTSIVFSIIEGLSQFFSLMFLVAELSIALALLLIRIMMHKEMPNPDVKKAFNFMYRGFGLSIFAAVIWFTIENLCTRPNFKWMQYTFAHSFWHFGISAGMYYLMQFFIFIHAFNTNRDPSMEMIWKVIPVVRYKKNNLIFNIEEN